MIDVKALEDFISLAESIKCLVKQKGLFLAPNGKLVSKDDIVQTLSTIYRRKLREDFGDEVLIKASVDTFVDTFETGAKAVFEYLERFNMYKLPPVSNNQ